MTRTLLLLALLCAPAAPAREPAGTLATRPVVPVEQTRATERTPRLRPLGMLELPEMSVNGLRLSQLSGLAWDEDEQILHAISDKGALFHLRPLWREGTLTGVRLLRAVALKEANGKALKGSRADSEGLDILNGRNGRKGDTELIVSFERDPRIVRYRPDGTLRHEYSLPAPLHERGNYRRGNKALEAVCVDDKLGILTVPEEPLVNERANFNRLFRIDGGSWPVPLMGRFRPSAIECLGDGRVLILERDFGTFTGRAVMLRRAVLSGDGRNGNAAAAETVALMDAADGWQIDNFEGLARHIDNRFFMVSDNNDLFVQRTLLFYFELVER